jgi:hypothetical protein
MIGIADIQLIPRRNVPSAATSEEKSDGEAESLEEARTPDHVFRDDPTGTAFFCTKLLETADGMAISREDATAQQTIQAQFARARCLDGID